MNPRHPALKKLHFRSTEAEVNQAMQKAGAPNYRYAKDAEFRDFVLRDIQTVEQAEAFIGLLNADCHARGYKHDCQKTWALKNLAKKVKKYKYLTPASFLSSARRTCCSCHELCSFALRK